jgi:hypothetical protein
MGGWCDEEEESGYYKSKLSLQFDITPPGLRSDWRQTHRLAGSFIKRSACHDIRVSANRPIRCDE